MPKPCKWCEGTDHTSLMCFRRPRPLLKTRKAIHKFGPTAAKMMEAYNEWLQQNPPDKNGEWDCYLPVHHPLCPRKLTIETLTRDHVEARSRRPDLKFDPKNFRPASYWCNQAKGSLTVEEYAERNQQWLTTS